MAQRIEVHLVDDVDGTDASETITFGLDGRTYDIDLSDANAAKLRGALETWIAKARKTSRGSSKVAARSIAPAAPQRARASNAHQDHLAKVRAWAADNGYQVSARGRIPSRVVQAYEAARAS